jgi:hypothetical protein
MIQTGIIIGFTGKAGAGKDTAADYLCNHYGFVKLSFAEPIKRALCAMLEDFELFSPERKEAQIEGLDYSITPRRLAQTLGTEWGRNAVYADFWTDLWLIKANRLLAAGRSIVVPDVRFNNENDLIFSKGGKVIKILGRANSKVNPHESEEQAIVADGTVYNETSFQILYEQVDYYLRKWYDSPDDSKGGDAF